MRGRAPGGWNVRQSLSKNTTNFSLNFSKIYAPKKGQRKNNNLCWEKILYNMEENGLEKSDAYFESSMSV